MTGTILLEKESLEAAMNGYEKWLIFFGILVAIGVIGESIFGFLQFRRSGQLHDVQRAENLLLQQQVADAQKQAADSSKYLAEANRRAADAQTQAAAAEKQAADSKLALERFKAPRHLSPQQMETIIETARHAAGTAFTLGVYNDKESIDLMGQISQALIGAGWKESSWSGGGDLVLNRGADHPNAGYVMVDGLYVQADSSEAAKLAPVVQKLSVALEYVGLATKAEIGHLPENDNKSAVRILVGKKPP
jgi:hypothetical protein